MEIGEIFEHPAFKNTIKTIEAQIGDILGTSILGGIYWF